MNDMKKSMEQSRAEDEFVGRQLNLLFKREDARMEAERQRCEAERQRHEASQKREQKLHEIEMEIRREELQKLQREMLLRALRALRI